VSIRLRERAENMFDAGGRGSSGWSRSSAGERLRGQRWGRKEEGWRRAQGIDLRWEVEGRAAMINALGMYTVRMIAAGRSRVVRRSRRCGAGSSFGGGGLRSIEGDTRKAIGAEGGDGNGGEGWLYQEGGVGSGAISAVE
jgi:hypothetical protein